ncbi:hypothetical protein RB7125 [Rhodopirellula baltica SH 1]|uniref:Uncharacterized protein n=1 Tax=Rhodopirellula baltica (strain DSM 10527 / NCIMB 13988 / SH1) TaxID=243090 RepID=Q7UP69_RHOBA|nr:hypothetical protein RB7125 [Rhodopirellula baltica SH 1]
MHATYQSAKRRKSTRAIKRKKKGSDKPADKDKLRATWKHIEIRLLIETLKPHSANVSSLRTTVPAYSEANSLPPPGAIR